MNKGRHSYPSLLMQASLPPIICYISYTCPSFLVLPYYVPSEEEYRYLDAVERKNCSGSLILSFFIVCHHHFHWNKDGCSSSYVFDYKDVQTGLIHTKQQSILLTLVQLKFVLVGCLHYGTTPAGNSIHAYAVGFLQALEKSFNRKPVRIYYSTTYVRFSLWFYCILVFV